MSTLKLLHIADMHMDSAFQGLSAGKAAARRVEQRQLLSRMARLCREEQVQLVLMSGDLLDSDSSYAETGEALVSCLAGLEVPVFIAPGNHDFYSARSPYARLKLPENVHVFTENRITCVELPALSARVYGAAFVDRQSPPLLEDFSAPTEDGVYNLLCLHGEVGVPQSVYNPIREEQLAASGLHYAALGHVHKGSGLLQSGGCRYSWPGCPEGRGFDETGEKYVNIVELDGADCRLSRHCIAHRRYELLKVDLTGAEPLLAIHSALPDETVRDIYRIVLTGEVERAPDLTALYANLSEFFFALQLRDETQLRRELWEQGGDDSLRGIFLDLLRAQYDSTQDEVERMRIEQAARWGLAALNRGEEVIRHEDS